MKKHLLYFICANLLTFTIAKAQDDDLLKLVDEKPKKEFSSATFKTTRLINFHTVEVVGRRALDFRISHRFGDFNSGPFNAWGIDGGANIRLALEYSHDGRLMFGIGRTSARKIADGFVKYRLLRQTINGSMPISLTLFSSMYHTFERAQINGMNKYQRVYDRLSYCNQIMVARKFNSHLSLQLLGAMVHYNLVDDISEGNNCYLAGVVARYKITTRQAITVEYARRLNSYSKKNYYDSFGIGYDLETGGHVFQIHLTNSFGLTENQYFMYTASSWQNWGIRLGFNISRVFGIQGRSKD
ncbi:MAG: hypothetical protein IT236_19365 [Bacteroidia bacterium]|nr:hypothetical protein [Bacteroidia bacterium]